LIIADELRANCTSFLGNPDIHLPNLEKIAQKAYNYTHHISQSPVCGPSRATMKTGRYPHSHGTISNLVGIDSTEKTYIQMLTDAGYQCVGFGTKALESESSSYAHAELGISYYSPQYKKYLESLDVPIDLSDYKPVTALTSPSNVRYGLLPWELKYHIDGYTTDRAIQYLNNLGNEPFYFQLEFHLPHPPYLSDKQFFSLYDPNKIKISDAFATVDRHPVLKRLYEDNRYGEVTEEELREITVHYYAGISFVDYQIGRFLDAMQQQKLLDNTHIIFTADHGDFCGELGMFNKANLPAKSLVHVPLLWLHPDGCCEEVLGYTQHTDIAPAILEMAEVDVPYYIEGNNLFEHKRSWGYSEIATVEFNSEIERWTKQAYYASYLDDEWHYIYSTQPGHSSLYHLEKDPHCHRNVIEQNKTKEDELRNALFNKILINTIPDQNDSHASWAEYRDEDLPYESF